MAVRNSDLFRGPDFEKLVTDAQEEHAYNVVGNGGRVYWREPSAHDIKYSRDAADGSIKFFPDGVPVEPSLGQPEPEDIADRVRRIIQGKALANAAKELGMDTPEEALDFDVEPMQNFDPFSGHEYSEQDEADDALKIAEARKLKDEADRKASDDRVRAELARLYPKGIPSELLPASTPPVEKKD